MIIKKLYFNLLTAMMSMFQSYFDDSVYVAYYIGQRNHKYLIYLILYRNDACTYMVK